MIEIIGVRFRKNTKIYYFSPEEKKYSVGEKVIVETAKGVECGEVVLDNRLLKNKDVPYQELKKIDDRILPRIYYIFDGDEEIILVEEYICGITLNELIEQKKIYIWWRDTRYFSTIM